MPVKLDSLVIDQGMPRFEATADGHPCVVILDSGAILALRDKAPAKDLEAALEAQRGRVINAAVRLWSQGFTTEAEGRPAIIVTALDL